MPLTTPQYQTAVTLLTPHFNGSSEHRKAIASLPLHGLAVMTKIQWDMTGADAFTAHLVSVLELFDDKVSVCNLLRHIAESVGEPSQSRMNDLVRDIEDFTPLSVPPSVPGSLQETLTSDDVLVRIRILRDERDLLIEQLSRLSAIPRPSYTLEGRLFQVGGALFLVVFAFAIHPVIGIAILIAAIFTLVSKISIPSNSRNADHNKANLVKRLQAIEIQLKNLYAISSKNL